MHGISTVAIRLDAFHLATDRSVLEAMADFSRLPYAGGEQDVDPDAADLSQEIPPIPSRTEGCISRRAPTCIGPCRMS